MPRGTEQISPPDVGAESRLDDDKFLGGTETDGKFLLYFPGLWELGFLTFDNDSFEVDSFTKWIFDTDSLEVDSFTFIDELPFTGLPVHQPDSAWISCFTLAHRSDIGNLVRADISFPLLLRRSQIQNDARHEVSPRADIASLSLLPRIPREARQFFVEELTYPRAPTSMAKKLVVHCIFRQVLTRSEYFPSLNTWASEMFSSDGHESSRMIILWLDNE